MSDIIRDPPPRHVFRRAGLSDACADRVALRLLPAAALGRLADGRRPDPAWLREWAQALARRVRAEGEG
jgi:hypothetical protein